MVLARTVIKALLALGLVLVLAWAGIQWVGMSLSHPEVSNPADEGPDDERLLRGPEFVVSDATLLRRDGILIQDRIVGSESGRGLDGAPYVVLLADGRYAYGYADSEGRTRPIRVEKPVPYEVFWYDGAWKQRDALAEQERRTGKKGIVVEGPKQP